MTHTSSASRWLHRATWRNSNAASAALHARPLDRERPLWKIYYIDGLSGGRAAYFNVVHHACLDGLAGQTAVETLTDAAPDAYDPRPASVEPVATGKSRSAFELIADAARRFDALARLGNRLLAPGGSTLGALAPNTPINRAIGAARGYAMLRISMTDVKAIGKSHGCSINDVFLTFCGGALRAYLLRRGALPQASLIAGVPVSVRQPGDRTMNTQVTMTRVSLATQIDDPIARLVAVHASSDTAKATAQDINALIPADLRVLRRTVDRPRRIERVGTERRGKLPATARQSGDLECARAARDSIFQRRARVDALSGIDSGARRRGQHHRAELCGTLRHRHHRVRAHGAGCRIASRRSATRLYRSSHAGIEPACRRTHAAAQCTRDEDRTPLHVSRLEGRLNVAAPDRPILRRVPLAGDAGSWHR